MMNEKKKTHIASFLSNLEHVVLEKALRIDKRPSSIRENAKYKIGKFNLLLNKGFIGVDQQAHTDYKSRLAT